MSFSLGGSSNKSSSTTTNPYAVQAYNNAQSALGNSTYTPLSSTAYQTYLNPFTSDVVSNLQTQAAKTQAASENAVDDASIAAGAFGGSRAAVQKGVASAENQDNLNNTIAQLLANQYNTATSTAQAENTAANQYPLLLQQLLTSAAQGTTTNTTGKSSGVGLGLSYTYGGK